MAKDQLVSLTLRRTHLIGLKHRFQAPQEGLDKAIEKAIRNGVFFCYRTKPEEKDLAGHCDVRQGEEKIEIKLSNFFSKVIFEKPEDLGPGFSNLPPKLGLRPYFPLASVSRNIALENTTPRKIPRGVFT